MSVAGSSRPCSGACHEILHAVNRLYPSVGNHGELAALGALFASWLRGDDLRVAQLVACLQRHYLPCRPQHLGLSVEQLADAVVLAPSTRPGRFTILEHLELKPSQALDAVRRFDAEMAQRLEGTDEQGLR
jgi:glycerol-1-phosphate dehydrogenase [NAD(P)+]